MKIYFPNITFQDDPIVWDLNEETYKACCLFYCINQKNHFKKKTNSEIPIDIFEKIRGVTIDKNNMVTIKDVRTFKEKYEFLTKFYKQVERTVLPPIVKRGHTVFFKETSLEKRAEYTPIKRTCSVSISSISTYENIKLDQLIKNDDTGSTLWGDTVAYEKHFLQKTEEATSNTAIFLKSASTFNVMMQFEKNNQLYPLKSNLIKAIRDLLELLNPIYKSWYYLEGLKFNKKYVFLYFQDAVLEAMLNSRINNKPTEFEDGLAKLSPLLQKYAIDNARNLRAQLMLIKFYVLINPELKPDLATSENNHRILKPALVSLRNIILKQPHEVIEDIKEKLKEMTLLIVKSGKIDEMNIHNQLHHALSIKAPIIMNFYSFQALLQIILEKQCNTPKKESPEIVDKITAETVRQISGSFNHPIFNRYIAPLSTKVDQDFYLCPDWKEKLFAELGTIKIRSSYKKAELYSQAIADLVIKFLINQLKQYIPEAVDITCRNSIVTF